MGHHRHVRPRWVALVVVLLACISSACGGGSPTSPSSASGNSGSFYILGSVVVERQAGPYQYTAWSQSASGVSDVTPAATWSVSNAQFGSFSSLGGRPVFYSSNRSGTFTITATYQGKTATHNVTAY